MLECARTCVLDMRPRDPFDYVQRDLLACVTGGPRPRVLDSSGRFEEGEPDGDAGSTGPNCLAECFPSW